MVLAHVMVSAPVMVLAHVVVLAHGMVLAHVVVSAPVMVLASVKVQYRLVHCCKSALWGFMDMQCMQLCTMSLRESLLSGW